MPNAFPSPNDVDVLIHEDFVRIFEPHPQQLLLRDPIRASYISKSHLPRQIATKSTARSPIILVDNFTGFNLDNDTSDGVHPNIQGATKIANNLYSAFKKAKAPS